MPVQDRHGLEAFSQLFLRSQRVLNQFRLDLELVGDVLHDIDATRDLALTPKGYRGIQNGFVGPIQTLDLDNLAQCCLALFDGTCNGPILTSDRPTGIRPPPGVIFVVFGRRGSPTPNPPGFLVQLLNCRRARRLRCTPRLRPRATNPAPCSACFTQV